MSTDAELPTMVRKSVIGCAAASLAGAALLVFLAPSMVGMGRGQMVVGGFSWVLITVGALFSWVFTLSPTFLAFLALSATLCGACLNYKLHNKVPSHRTDSFVMISLIGAVTLAMLGIGHLELKKDRLGMFALGHSSHDAAVSYDAMTTEEVLAQGKDISWAAIMLRRNTQPNGSTLKSFGPPNCRRAVRNFQTSSVMHRYHMEIRGTLVTESTNPASVCPAFKTTEIKLTKVN